MYTRLSMVTGGAGSSLLLIVALAMVAGACGDDTGDGSGRITAIITSVTPEAGFVPAEIQFVGDFEAVEGVGNVEPSWDFGDGAGSDGTFTVTHTYEQAGSYEVVFTAREVGNDGATRSESTAMVTVEVYPQAELRATLPFFTPASVRSQDDWRVTYDIFNDAGEIPVAFTSGVYLAEPGTINPSNPPDTDTLRDLVLSSDAFLVDTFTFDSFGADGAQQTVDNNAIRIAAEVPTGEYAVFVYVDDEGIVGEFDEQNNLMIAGETLRFFNTSTEGPDLLVTNVRARPSRTNLLESLTVDIEVTNAGTEIAPLFQYEVYLSFLNEELDESDTLLTSGQVNAVAAGTESDLDTLEITLDEAQAALGNYFVVVLVDSDDDVDEANENNNVGASNAVLVTDEPIPGVDLIPTAFSFEPSTSFLDGGLSLTASVQNQGEENTDTGFFCRVYLSEDDELEPDLDAQLDAINFPPLLGGEELEVEKIALIPGFFNPGLYFVFLSCDPTFRIPEADEDNNVLQADGRLEISSDPEIDVLFQTFDVSPLTVANEEDVTLTMTVCNDGTNGAGPSFLRVWISADGSLEPTDTLLHEVLIDSVDADECIELVEMVPAICDTFQPSYTVFAQLDATDLLPETNENNNEATVSPFVIEGVICQCEVDVLETNASGNNNSPSTPTFISARTYRDLTMCDLARDWYAIPLEAGETVRVVITFEQRRGNLDMILFGADRASVLDSSTSNGDREEVIGFVVPEDGDYLLKVFGRSDPLSSADANVYDMTVTITPPLSGIDLLVANVELSNDMPVLAESVDVTFDLINIGDTAAGPNSARLYLSDDIEIDPGDDLLLGETDFTDVPGASGLRRRTVTVNMPGDDAGGDRYIGVVADAENDVPGELDESNNVGVSDLFVLDAACFDPLEPNNSIENAYEVTLNGPITTLTGLLVCSNNRDFYYVCAEAGDFLTLTTRFDGELNDVDMRLYSGTTQIDRAEGTGSEEVLGIDFIAADQCYTLEVIVIGAGREAAYELIIETGPAPEELICNGMGEPNEGFSGAPNLGDFLDTDLAVCPVSDIDFYRFVVSASTALTFEFLPVGEDPLPSAIRMSLWGPSRNFLANTVQSDEPLVFQTVSTGTHWLRVTSQASGPRNQPYRLSVTGLEGRDLQPVNYIIDPAIVPPGDRVQYEFDLVNNRSLATGAFEYGVYLSQDPVIDPDDDELLRLVDIPGIAGFGTRFEASRVDIPTNAPGGLNFLGVFVDIDDDVDEFEESNNVALLPLSILIPCTVDEAEPNNRRADAVELGPLLGAELWLCPNDEDWFVLSGLTPDISYQLDATFTTEAGDLDLFIYDGGNPNTLLGEGVTVGDNESVTFTAPAAGSVYVQAEGFGLTNFAYTLSVSPEP